MVAGDPGIRSSEMSVSTVQQVTGPIYIELPNLLRFQSLREAGSTRIFRQATLTLTFFDLCIEPLMTQEKRTTSSLRIGSESPARASHTCLLCVTDTY